VDYTPTMKILQCLHDLCSIEYSELDGQPFFVKLFDQFRESAPLDILVDKVEVFFVLNIHISLCQSYIP